MSDDELAAILDSLEQDSTAYNSEFMKQNEEYLRRYYKEPYGDEEEGFSQVVASDVSDLVESDMTSMVRVFLGSGDVMVFEPMTDDPEEKEEAKLKTQYINHLILKRPGQYKVIHDFLKDAEIQKMGVLYYYMDTVRDTREIKYKNLDALALTQLMEDIKAKDKTVVKVEVTQKDEIETAESPEGGPVEVSVPSFDVWLRITTEYQDLVIRNITTEDFLISKNASTVDDAQMVGHISYPTRSELVASGMTEEDVAKYPASSQAGTGVTGNQRNTGNSGMSSTMKSIRWRDEGGDIIDGAAFGEWSAETVRMVTMSAKIDYDRDGIAERRRIVKIGNDVIENEPYDHVPYAVTSAIIEPHKAIGEGRASLVVSDQSVNTALERALLDNTYDVTRPRTILDDGVNIDDFLDHRADGIVRKESNGIPARDSVFPLTTPYIGNETLQVLQYRDQQQAARAGAMLDSQGLEADQLHRETATRFNGMERAREAKIELVARNHAETGFRKLYEGVAWTVNRYQDKEQQVRITGKAIRVNPSDWKFPSIAVSQVGLGAGSGQKSVQQATGLLQIQQQLQSVGSLLVDDQAIYNTLDKLVQGLGLARTDDYFNNPDIPQDLLFAQYQQLVQAAQQMQMQLEQMGQANPLAEAEMIKAKASLENAKGKAQVELIKADAQKEIKQMEMIKDTAQFEAEQTLKYTELELENNVDIPGVGQ